MGKLYPFTTEFCLTKMLPGGMKCLISECIQIAGSFDLVAITLVQHDQIYEL